MTRIRLSKVRIADKWWVMITVTLGMFMSLMDHTIVNVAIPQMQLAFGADIQAVQWVVTIYMLTQAVVIPTAPYLTQKLGGKRAYLWTLTAFLLGSALCGFAWSLPSLVFFRLLQGIGGGILLPLVRTLLFQAFPIEERGTAVSTMGISLMAAPMMGPVLGGFLVTQFGWPWAFFINIPLGIVALIIAQKALRHTSGAQETRFDGPGFLTAATGSAALLYAVSSVSSGGGSIGHILLLVVGALLLLAFAVTEIIRVRRGQEVLLDLRRFQDRTFAFSGLANLFVALARFGTLFLIPIYLQTLRQQTPFQTGAILAVQALATVIVLPIGGRLADRIGPRPVSLVGLAIFASATGLMTMLTLDTPIWMLMGMLAGVGAASGLVNQIQVSAMSQIEKDEHKEIANGSTILTMLHATAAPMGVALLSSMVQGRSQQYAQGLAAGGVTGELLQQQSTLLAMQNSFFIATCLVLTALLSMRFVPKRNGSLIEQPT